MAVPAALQAQLDRRSSSLLVEPGPTDAQLSLILRAATTVPDHGSLRPWRFVVVRDEARELFGDALAQAAAERLGADDPRTAKMRTKAFVAPALVVMIASFKESPKVPASEQRSSAACTGYAMALAASSLGLGAVWKTSTYLTGSQLTKVLGLEADEEIIGWINLGQRGKDKGPELPRIEISEVATELRADTTREAFQLNE